MGNRQSSSKHGVKRCKYEVLGANHMFSRSSATKKSNVGQFSVGTTNFGVDVTTFNNATLNQIMSADALE